MFRLLLLIVLCITPLKALERIALGGCIWEDKPMPFWEQVLACEPELFLFNGDNVYADTEDEAEMRRAYGMLADNPGFQQLKAGCRLLATWDDHDYGLNDGGAEFPARKMSQRVFCDFWELEKQDPRRLRDGVYHSEMIESAGRRIQVILLDGRSFRGPLLKKPESMKAMPGRYLPDWRGGELLGEAQWQWLEAQLKLPADLRLVVSGIQVIPDQHGWECWGNLPLERERLFQLIRDTQAGGVLLISGDRHHCELSRLDVDQWNSVGYPLLEITSSGMNSCYGGLREDEVNRFQLGGPAVKENNFGMITIDWKRPDPLIRLELLDAETGRVFRETSISLSELRAVTDPAADR